MLDQAEVHQTTPRDFTPDGVSESDGPHQMRVSLDNLATTRGLILQMSARLMAMVAAPDDDERRTVAAEFAGFAEQFDGNMELIYGTGDAGDVPPDRAAWIRDVAGRADKRRDRMQQARSRIDRMKQEIAAEHWPSYKEARDFFATNWPDVRDDMTATIWELWADLDARNGKSGERLREMQKTLTDTLTEIKKISMTVRMIALNASVLASRAGEHGAGFSLIAVEVRNLAEMIETSANSAETTVRDIMDRGHT